MISILLVEENKRQLQFYADSLRRLQCEINPILASSAEEALALFSQNIIDGAFIDIRLPGMDGFSLARRIRDIDEYYFLPIIFATGEKNNLADTYKEYRNIDYLEKPFSLDVFLSAANRLIKEVKRHKTIYRKKGERKFTFLYDGGRTFITFSEILYVSTKPERKICLATNTNEYIRSNSYLRNVIAEINEEMFAQCHKAYVVNIENIQRIEKYSRKTWALYFRNAPGKICYMSQNYKGAIEKLLYDD